MFGTFFSRSLDFILISLVILVIIILNIYLLSWRHPDFLQDLNRIIEEQKKKYVKSHIDSLDIEIIKEKLEHFMQQDKPYLEEDVSLEFIATNLKLSNHQLSQFLNQILKKSFYQYINEFRVQEAIKIIQNDPKINILNVAYKVGFNSKSSFNTTFKKITGTTPSEYKKLSKNKGLN
ncbi:MAG: helix-turn-helix transcriptional regulator [Leptospiraceae bacterium]|nr:helix-turn-helix transcriptional regulator [Leptospiraceae bacterium]